RTVSIMRLLMSESDLWIPGVSTNTICAPGSVTTPWTLVRVVCGLLETIATFSPRNALSSVDFPAFGRPRIETKPARCLGLLTRPPRRRPCDAPLAHANPPPRDHANRTPVASPAPPLPRHVAEPLLHQAADRR